MRSLDYFAFFVFARFVLFVLAVVFVLGQIERALLAAGTGKKSKQYHNAESAHG
jgi:hypothetical protein